MTMRIDIVQQAPTIKIDPTGKIVMVDFKVLKGDKGDPGEPGVSGIVEHLSMFDHGDLHEHSNKALLDQLSWDSNEGLLYNGVSVLDLPAVIAVLSPACHIYVNGSNQGSYSGRPSSVGPIPVVVGQYHNRLQIQEGCVSVTIHSYTEWTLSITLNNVFGNAVVLTSYSESQGG